MLETAMEYGYIGLFFASLLAATLIAAPSDLMAMGMPAAGYDPVMVGAVAVAGGFLGNLVNYAVGRYGTVFFFRRVLQNEPDKSGEPDEPDNGTLSDNKWYQRAERIYGRYGVWSLLLSGTPFIGDPLTTVAGAFRVNLWVFCVLVLVGKVLKFTFLLGGVDVVRQLFA